MPNLAGAQAFYHSSYPKALAPENGDDMLKVLDIHTEHILPILFPHSTTSTEPWLLCGNLLIYGLIVL